LLDDSGMMVGNAFFYHESFKRFAIGMVAGL
jgi:hypothetical protein